jgi:hypothetical protein
VCALKKREGNDMSVAHVAVAQHEKTVTISEKEYLSLLATAELFQQSEIFQFTVKNLTSKGEVPLEEAFRD